MLMIESSQTHESKPLEFNRDPSSPRPLLKTLVAFDGASFPQTTG